MLVEVACGNALKQVDNVGLQAQHDGLCLRIAHTAVVLDDHWLTLDIDEAEEDKSFVVNAFCCQSLDGRTDDAVFHLLHPLLCGEGYGGYAAHATGVQARVVLTYALVVLGLGQYLVVLSVS